jgi:hypothetical protein
MLRRIAIGCVMALLLGGSALAADENPAGDTGDNECTRQLTKTEEIVNDKIDANALSEADAEKVNELLDEADALCTEGNFAEASATFAAIDKMVASKGR